jgi:hypothetical protein
VSEGNEVEVIGAWQDGTLRAGKIVNLSTHAEVFAVAAVALIFFAMV